MRSEHVQLINHCSKKAVLLASRNMLCDMECSCTPTLTRLAWQLVMAYLWAFTRTTWTHGKWGEPCVYRSELHSTGTISLLPSDLLQNTKGQSVGPPYCMAGRADSPFPPSAALGGSPGERALAASAFSVISLNSWERARCQKCWQVNSSPLSSASDFTPVTLSVFIFCWEGLSVRPVNLFQV